jgi:hypothetical protein
MLNHIRSICAIFKSRLTFGSFGFANTFSDFSILKKMTEEANAEGIECGSLHGLLSSLVTSLTDTRALLSSIRPPAKSSTVELRRPGLTMKIDNPLDITYRKNEWTFYGKIDQIRRLRPIKKILSSTIEFIEEPLISNVAEVSQYFGEGPKRIVHQMTEVDKYDMPVGDPLILKINPAVEEDGRNQVIFHVLFGRTQHEASRFVAEFNERLDFLKVPHQIFRLYVLYDFY